MQTVQSFHGNTLREQGSTGVASRVRGNFINKTKDMCAARCSGPLPAACTSQPLPPAVPDLLACCRLQAGLSARMEGKVRRVHWFAGAAAALSGQATQDLPPANHTAWQLLQQLPCACCNCRLQDATKAEQPDVVALDQVQPQLHGAYVAQQQQAHLGVGAGAQAPPSAALWAPASADAQHSRDTLPGHTNLLSRLSLPGLASTLELEAGLAAASGVDPLSTSGGLHGLWSGSDSRGTTPSSTTSSSGGRLQPVSDQKASELALQVNQPRLLSRK